MSALQWRGWGIHVNLTAPPGTTEIVPPFADLRFDPIGIYNLRRRLGAFPRNAGVFAMYQRNFRLSDIAWFAAGLHQASVPNLGPDTLLPGFWDSRDGMGSDNVAKDTRKKCKDELRDGLFDLVSV